MMHLYNHLILWVNWELDLGFALLALTGFLSLIDKWKRPGKDPVFKNNAVAIGLMLVGLIGGFITYKSGTKALFEKRQSDSLANVKERENKAVTQKFLNSQIELKDLYKRLDSTQRELSNSQSNIYKNTLRGLQPVTINSVTVAVDFKFDNSNALETVKKITALKDQLETDFAKSRSYNVIPKDMIVFFGNNLKINGDLIIQQSDFLNTCGLLYPNIVFQFGDKLPVETKEKLKNGENLIHYKFPVSLEFQSYGSFDQYKVIQINVDFSKKVFRAFLQPLQIHWTDKGEIVSYLDLFGKYLKVSAYYNGYIYNSSKLDIATVNIVNDKKRIFFVLKPTEKVKAYSDPNAAYIHKIVAADQVK